MNATRSKGPVYRAQKGLTLIELMVALAIALFLLGGMLTILQSNRRAYTTEIALANLQDSERFALSVIADSVQIAGYFPDPTTQSASSAFVSDATFSNAGSFLAGASNISSAGDSLAVRYLMAPHDGLQSCDGTENTGSADFLSENVFSVNSSGQLVCSVNDASALPLVSGIKSMTVSYGVNLSATPGTFTTYLQANQMNASDWANVACVKILLTFDNPLAGQAGQPATVSLTRVIDVMNAAGVSGASSGSSSGGSGSSGGATNSNGSSGGTGASSGGGDSSSGNNSDSNSSHNQRQGKPKHHGD